MNRAPATATSRALRGATPAVPLRAWCRGSVLRHTIPPAPRPHRAEADRSPAGSTADRLGFTHHVALGCAWVAVRAIQGLRTRGVLRPRHVSRLLPVIVRMSGVSDGPACDGLESPLRQGPAPRRRPPHGRRF
ncbi:hypothetical protein [Gluconacetobacter tumulisoli]|uniref:Uncharacterized protein n=1 Tax=Gluconacetobacter tumulisoli TaxID=1286189 RepID=A0A7W4K461_9PROT|nr:hypothetical protein [Gluconacetobacter tumulisoli]MBB2200056.1 hypothetical protein [Gluconacetobacter tumulisoli]